MGSFLATLLDPRMIAGATLIRLTTLAQAGGDRALPQEAGQRMREIVMWALLLVVAAVVFVLLAMWFRRQFLGGPGRGAHQPIGFTLADLRRLRAEGKMTQQEYERTRDRIVHAAQRAITDAVDDDDRPPPDAPRTKDVDLIRDAER